MSHFDSRFSGSLDSDEVWVQSILQNRPTARLEYILLPALNADALRHLANRAQASTLPPDFKLRKSPFFKKGRILCAVWAEPAGALGEHQYGPPNNDENLRMSQPTQSSDVGAIYTCNYGEKVYSNMKMFVIFKEGENYCLALKIDTYGGRGCRPLGVITKNHAIMYSGKRAPNRLPVEYELLEPPIRANLDGTTIFKLDESTRINFGKVYTIEHNIRVASVGEVHSDSIGAMESHFSKVLSDWPMNGQNVLRQELVSGDEHNLCSLSRLDSGSLESTYSRINLPVHKLIRGAKLGSEQLVQDYFVQITPHEFFTVGKVFTIMSWEECVRGPGHITTITDNVDGFSKHGEPEFVQRRWFVVIKEGKDSCLCLRIQSYEYRGVPDGFVKRQHCIVYTGKVPPKPMPYELASRDDLSSLQEPVRIKRFLPLDPKLELSPMHRLCYSEVYEVKHDVMARGFGVVHNTLKWSLKPLAEEIYRETTAHLLNQHDYQLRVSERQLQQLSSSECSEDEGLPSPIEEPNRQDEPPPSGCPPQMFHPANRVLLPGKDKPTVKARFKPLRIHEARLAPCRCHWEYSLKHEKHEGLFAPGQFFSEDRLIKDEGSASR